MEEIVDVVWIADRVGDAVAMAEPAVLICYQVSTAADGTGADSWKFCRLRLT
jgi:hypothetical protein